MVSRISPVDSKQHIERNEAWLKCMICLEAAEMGFLRRVAGVSLRDKVRSSVIREGL